MRTATAGRIFVGLFALGVVCATPPRNAEALFLGWVKNKVENAGRSAVSGVSSAASSVSSSVSSAWSNVRAGVMTATQALESVGKTVWTGIKSGVRIALDQLQQLLDWVWQKVKAIAPQAWSVIKSQPCNKMMDALFGFTGSLPVPSSVGTVLGGGIYFELLIQALAQFAPDAAATARQCDTTCRQEFVKGFVCSMPNLITDIPRYAVDFAQSAWDNRGICFGWGLLGMLTPAGISAPLLCGAGYWVTDKLPKAIRCVANLISGRNGSGGLGAFLKALLKRGCNFAGGKVFDLLLAAATGGTSLSASLVRTLKDIAQFKDVAGKATFVLNAASEASSCEAAGATGAGTGQEIQGYTAQCTPRPTRLGGRWHLENANLRTVSIAGDGTIWGTTASQQIRRKRPGHGWETIPGALVEVSTGGSEVWGVNGAGLIYRWNGSNWTKVYGGLVNVSVGSDGTVWGVNRGQAIFRWDAGTWTHIPGGLTQISVGSASVVWGVNAAGEVLRWGGDAWQQVPGPVSLSLPTSPSPPRGLAGLFGRVQRIVGAVATSVAPRPLNLVAAAADGTVLGRGRDGSIWYFNGCGWSSVANGRGPSLVGRQGDTTGVSTLHDFSVASGSTIAAVVDGRLLTAVPAPPPPPAPGTNLARGKFAQQSSTYAHPFGPGAAMAVDGRTDGNWNARSTTHTNNGREPWWQVDLGAQHSVDEVRVYNRTDCCGARLANFYVLVSTKPFGGRSLAQVLADRSVWRRHHPAAAPALTTVKIGGSGRYVRIQLAGQGVLSLAEVEVLAGRGGGG